MRRDNNRGHAGPTSLKSAAVSGAKWTTVSTGFTAVIQSLQVTVLAWWLKPSDFGLMAMSMLVLNFAEICLDFGMSKAIIHRQDTSREQLSSLYWVNVFVGWVLFAACFAATPLVVIMFREPRLYHLVPLVSALFLIGPIGAQFALLLQKELRFRSLAVVEIVGSLMGALAAIGAAIAGLGVYALVLAQLAGSIVSTAILTMIGLRHWRPMFHFMEFIAKHNMPGSMMVGTTTAVLDPCRIIERSCPGQQLDIDAANLDCLHHVAVGFPGASVAPACRPDLRDGILDRALFFDCPSFPFRRCPTRLAEPHDNLRFETFRM
jgi:hypothetical protein